MLEGAAVGVNRFQASTAPSLPFHLPVALHTKPIKLCGPRAPLRQSRKRREVFARSVISTQNRRCVDCLFCSKTKERREKTKERKKKNGIIEKSIQGYSSF